MVLSMPPGLYAADVSFDRFFTDKKTRMQLNQAREQHSFIAPRGNTSVDQPQELVLPDVKFDGMIIRNDGSAEVWINSTGSGHETNLGNKVEMNARRTKDGKMRITLPSGKTVRLKPGQVYSMETERVREAYEEIEEPPVPEKKGEEEEKAEDLTATEEARAAKEPEATFDEAALGEDSGDKIELLEERVQRLEGQADQK